MADALLARILLVGGVASIFGLIAALERREARVRDRRSDDTRTGSASDFVTEVRPERLFSLRICVLIAATLVVALAVIALGFWWPPS